MAVQWHPQILDKHVAPRYSELTSLGAEELPPANKTLASLVLNTSMFYPLRDPFRVLLFGIVRRVDQAYFEYEEGRAALLRFLKDSTGHRLSVTAYFRALANFEHCLSMFWQAAKFSEKISGEMPFKSGDGSFWEKLNKALNESKHMDDRIAKGEVPENATTAVWLTNEGIECRHGLLTFAELRSELLQAHDWTKELVEKAIPERIKENSQKAPTKAS